MSAKTYLFAALLAPIFALNAHASLIVNGNFESTGNYASTGAGHNKNLNNLAPGQWSVYKNIPGWTTFGGPGIEIQYNILGGDHTTGSGRHVELDSHGGRDTNSYMAQKLSGLTVGQTYEASFWYKPRTNQGGNDNGIQFLWGESLPLGTIDSIAPTRNEQRDWGLFNYLVTASAEDMWLGFRAYGRDNSLGGFVDDVAVVAVPEPGTLALLSLGLLGLGFSQKRKLNNWSLNPIGSFSEDSNLSSL